MMKSKAYYFTKKGLVFLIMLAVICSAGCSSSSRGDLKKIYDEYEGNTLLIGGWVTPRGEFVKTAEEAEARYKELADAGINMMYTFDDTDDPDRLKRVMDAAEKSGIKLVVHLDLNNFNHSLDIVNMTKDHPAVIGYILKDEPPASLFPGLLALRKKVYDIVGDDKIIMINLLPNYASDAQLGVVPKDGKTSYQIYVEQSMKIVNPTLLCTDYYMFRAGKDGDPGVLAGYYRNMFDLRDAANEYEVDLWGFLQNSGWAGMREPNKAELRFSAHVNLAFGVKCLAYFLCWNPHADSIKGDGRYDPTSMISYDGKITDNYYKVQAINKELHAMKGVYLDYKHKGIIMYEKTPFVKSTIPEENLLESFNELVSLDAARNTLVGCFEKEGKTGLYVVNCDYSDNGVNTVKLKLNDKHTYRIWSKDGLIAQKKSDTVSLKLIPGEGVFVQIID